MPGYRTGTPTGRIMWVCRVHTPTLFRWRHCFTARHSDNEAQMRRRAPVISISFGATRTFRIRERLPSGGTAGRIVTDIPLHDNDVLIMGGDMQRTHQHEITKVGTYARGGGACSLWLLPQEAHGDSASEGG
jgi:hypothetical protein